MSQVRVLSPLLALLRRLRGPTLLAFAAGVAALVAALAATIEKSCEERREEREPRYRVSFFTLGAAAAGLGVASLRAHREDAT